MREFHQTCQVSRGVNATVEENEVVIVYDENQPRSLWRLGRVESTLQGTDGKIRGARVRVQSKTGRSTVLQRPIQHLYPLEVGPRERDCTSPDHRDDSRSAIHASLDRQDNLNTAAPYTPDNGESPGTQTEVQPDSPRRRPRRSAATEARDKILAHMIVD